MEVYELPKPARDVVKQLKKLDPTAKPKDAVEKTKLELTIISGHNLPSMDKNGLSDPYVMIRHGVKEKRTKTIEKNLNPVWNETFRFKLDDESSLEISLYDWEFPPVDHSLERELTLSNGGTLKIRLARHVYTPLRV